MRLSLFYRNDCIQSRFLRIIVREQDWDLREVDASTPAGANELIESKRGLADGTHLSQAIVPCIISGEAYSHDIHNILEYLNERSPGLSMMPTDPTLRLFHRTVIQRLLRMLVPAWQANDRAALVEAYKEYEPLMAPVVKDAAVLRGNPEVPTYIGVLFALLLLEVRDRHPITSPVILRWAKEVVSRASFQELIPQFGLRRL